MALDPRSARRRALAAMTHENIRREAARIAEEQGIPPRDALGAVFADAELLARCVASGRPPLQSPQNPDMPLPTAAQE